MSVTWRAELPHNAFPSARTLRLHLIAVSDNRLSTNGLVCIFALWCYHLLSLWRWVTRWWPVVKVAFFMMRCLMKVAVVISQRQRCGSLECVSNYRFLPWQKPLILWHNIHQLPFCSGTSFTDFLVLLLLTAQGFMGIFGTKTYELWQGFSRV